MPANQYTMRSNFNRLPRAPLGFMTFFPVYFDDKPTLPSSGFFNLTALYFAADVHGSNICWNKFINAGKFYKAHVIILGGDMTGKAIMPIVHQGNNPYREVLLEHESILHGEDEVNEIARRIKSRRYYPC